MVKCLLSIDWDYFVFSGIDDSFSHLENRRNIIDLWYKKYIQASLEGKDIQKYFLLSPEVKTFWDNIKKNFKFSEDIKAYVSDSHALSYNFAKKYGCDVVVSFDAHSDLGYGGLSSLDFEVNCSNWLGKLLRDKVISKAVIIYSPYTKEKPSDFEQINRMYNVVYNDLSDVENNIASVVHICRSGAWTPPWLDKKFKEFVNALGLKYNIINCPKRKWDIANISFSDQIKYLMA